jgi:hypothetical protein
VCQGGAVRAMTLLHLLGFRSRLSDTLRAGGIGDELIATFSVDYTVATATREKPQAPLTDKAVTRPASAKPSLTKPSAATRKSATRVSTENVTPNQLNAAVCALPLVP